MIIKNMKCDNLDCNSRKQLEPVLYGGVLEPIWIHITYKTKLHFCSWKCVNQYIEKRGYHEPDKM